METEIRRLVEAIAQGDKPSPSIVSALREREEELAQTNLRLLPRSTDSVEEEIGEVRKFVTACLSEAPILVSMDVQRARIELARHVTETRMALMPGFEDRGIYKAQGQWNLLGGYSKTDQTRWPSDQRVWMVAEARYAPNLSALLLPFSIELR